MATDVASADAEKKPGADSKPKAVEDKRDGTAAASTMPAVQRCPGTSLGERQVQAQAASGNTRVGAADDAAERKADMAADHVMRQPDTAPPASASPSPAPASTPTGTPTPAGPSPSSGSTPAATPAEPVRRTEDPTAEQRLPGAETAKPATSGTGGAPGAGPDTMTPAGPAPLIAPPATAGTRPAETGTPAPDAEPPAPEGEAPARETPQVPNDVQEYLDASRGLGAPLPDATLKFFEDKFQRPFDDVRVHDDAGADDAARKIDALAFTRGNDIYFRSGAYDPTSQPGKKLLAHELAHVVQQRPGINRKAAPGLGGTVIRRAPATSAPTGAPKPWTHPNDPDKSIDISTRSIKLGELPYPAFKAGHPPKEIKLRTAKDKRTNKQRSLWLGNKENQDNAVTGLTEYLNELMPGEKGPYRLQSQGKDKSGAFYMGEPKDIGPLLVIPPWNSEGNWASWQVDHIAEWQIGGEDEDVTNYQLLDPTVNNASGKMILGVVEKQLSRLLDAARKDRPEAPKKEEIRPNNWSVTWTKLKPVPGLEPADTQIFKRDQIKTAKYMKGLQKLHEDRIASFEGTQKNLAIYPDRAGGQAAHPQHVGGNQYKYESSAGHAEIKGISWLMDKPNLTEEGPVGKVSANVLVREKGKKGKGKGKGEIVEVLVDAIDVDVLGIPKVVPWGGFLDRAKVKTQAKAAVGDKLLKLNVASPISFDDLDFDLDRGLSARGKVPKPDLKLLERASIFVTLENGEIGVEATITADEFQLPGPFKVQGGALTLSATTGGLSVTGQVDFEIQRLATGFIKAQAGTSTGFALDAELQFDKKMFDGDARIKGTYEDGKWAVEGTLGVGPGKIKGIKKASAAVSVTADTVTADGEFETSLKGVDKGKVGFKYNESTGMEITGEIILGQGIPGVKSGKLDATIKEGPTGHSLSGGVTLEPSVPGLTGTVAGHYEDGAFFVQADLGYEKGLAKGKVNIGLTNQTVGEDGKPAGPPKPDSSITAFGTGLVELTLTPWLKGKVGLKLTPTGEIEVSGEVALPPTFEVFGKLPPLEKEIFSVHIDIPIIGLSVAGVHVGIFATIGGGINVSAGIGPGVLRDVALKVTYNPDRPDDTTVTGTGSFAVPAHASLRITVCGGVGAGIPLVDAEAKLSAHGEIGLAGEASASVQVAWAPATGIVLDAHGDIFVEPKFKFGVDASVDVTVGVWRLKKTLYEHTWCLADFEFGSNLRFGLSLPIHYESLKPFDIAFDQIQWTYPQIKPKDLLSGLMEQLVSGPARTPEC